MSRWIGFVTFALCLLFVGTAWGDGHREDARKLAKQGARLYADGKYEQAIDHFRRADALFAAPQNKVYIARAYVALGSIEDARTFYGRALRRPKPGEPASFARARDVAWNELLQLPRGDSNADPYDDTDLPSPPMDFISIDEHLPDEPAESTGVDAMHVGMGVAFAVGAVGMVVGLATHVRAAQVIDEMAACTDRTCLDWADQNEGNLQDLVNVSQASWVIGFVGLATGTVLLGFELFGDDEGDVALRISPTSVGIAGSF